MASKIRQTELYLISSIIQKGDFTVAVSKGLGPNMFHGYRDEWEWLERYFTKHRRVPSKPAFRQQFPNFTLKKVDDTAHFAEEVRKNHARFELTRTVREVSEDLAAGDVNNALKLLQQSVVSVAANMDGVADRDIVEHVEEAYLEAKRRMEAVERNGMAGVSTGFQTLDEETGGIQPGDLFIIAARLGEGKTWLMLQAAAMASLQGKVVQFNSLEQSRAQVTMRVHALLSRALTGTAFNNNAIMQGKGYDLKQYKKFLHQLKREVAGQIHVTDASRGRVSPTTIAAQIERNQPDIVFIDYITLMDTSGPKDWKSIGELSSQLKMIGSEYGVPIVAAAQLNRSDGLGKEPPGPEAIAQADAIGQDADAVVTAKKRSESVQKLMLAKYRHGRAGFKWWVDFRPGEGIIEECSGTRAMELQDADDERRDQEEVD